MFGVEFDVYEGEFIYYNKSSEVIECLEEKGCIERQVLVCVLNEELKVCDCNKVI